MTFLDSDPIATLPLKRKSLVWGLEEIGVHTVGDVRKSTDAFLLRATNLGRGSLNEIRKLVSCDALTVTRSEPSPTIERYLGKTVASVSIDELKFRDCGAIDVVFDTGDSAFVAPLADLSNILTCTPDMAMAYALALEAEAERVRLRHSVRTMGGLST